ncbi:unnamed protein product, partial [Closterium sp. NIES-54]
MGAAGAVAPMEASSPSSPSSPLSSSASSTLCPPRRLIVVPDPTNSKVILESTQTSHHLCLSRLIPVPLLLAFFALLVLLLSPIPTLAACLPREVLEHTPRNDGLSHSATSETALRRLTGGTPENRRRLPSRVRGEHPFLGASTPSEARQLLGNGLWAGGGRRRLGEGGGDMHARLAPLWDMASRVAVNGTVVIVSANAGELYGMVSYRASYRIVSCHIVPYRIVSYRIISHCIVSCHIVAYRIESYRIVSYRIVSYQIESYRIASHQIESYRIASHRIESYSGYEETLRFPQLIPSNPPLNPPSPTSPSPPSCFPPQATRSCWGTGAACRRSGAALPSQAHSHQSLDPHSHSALHLSAQSGYEELLENLLL